jgi:hypothetical protein
VNSNKKSGRYVLVENLQQVFDKLLIEFYQALSEKLLCPDDYAKSLLRERL